MVSTQLGAAAAKQLLGPAGPAGLTLLRLLLAALALAVLAAPALRAMRWPTWRQAVLIAAFGLAMGGMNLTFYTALQYVPLGVAVPIGFVGPLVVALAGSRRYRDAAWALLAAGGVFLLSADLGGVALPRIGLLLSCVTAVCWGAYIVLGGRLTVEVPGTGLALGMCVAAVAVAPLGLVDSGPALLRPDILAVALAVALLSSVVPYTLELAALRRIPAATFAVLLSLEPALAAAIGYAVLDERLAPLQLAGVVGIVVASIAVTRSSAR